MKLNSRWLTLLVLCTVIFFTCENENRGLPCKNGRDSIFHVEHVVDQILRIYEKSPRFCDFKSGKATYLLATTDGLTPNEIYLVQNWKTDYCSCWSLRYVFSSTQKGDSTGLPMVHTEDGMSFNVSEITSQHGNIPKPQCTWILDHFAGGIIDFPNGPSAPNRFLFDEKNYSIFATVDTNIRLIKIRHYELEDESNKRLKELIDETIQLGELNVDN